MIPLPASYRRPEFAASSCKLTVDAVLPAFPAVHPAVDGAQPKGYTIPTIDISGETHRQIVVDREAGQYLGHPSTLLAHAEHFLRQTLPIAGRIQSERFERIDEPLYPPVAIRESLANALCHRDYSIGGGSVGLAVYDDRLEVTSSGALHFGLTPEKLFAPHESLPWNPLIARTFYRRGIIEEWGRGTLKMAELTVSAGLPYPQIEDVGGCVTVRFQNDRFAQQHDENRAAKREKTILTLLERAENGLALRRICARLDPQIGERQVKRTLKALRDRGLAAPIGRGQAARWILVRDR